MYENFSNVGRAVPATLSAAAYKNGGHSPPYVLQDTCKKIVFTISTAANITTNVQVEYLLYNVSTVYLNHRLVSRCLLSHLSNSPGVLTLRQEEWRCSGG